MTNFSTPQIAYTYDGSFYGMLCCVFESLSKKELPLEVVTNGVSMFSMRHIETCAIKAERILKSIPIKINDTALDYVKFTYLADIEQKELSLIHFLLEGYKCGKDFIQDIKMNFQPSRKYVAGTGKNVHIDKIVKGVDLLVLEAHRFVMFVRFSDYNGSLVAVIEPVAKVLPLMADHFVERYPNENFLIYDKTNKLALIYNNKQTRIEYIEQIDLPTVSLQEQQSRKLWKLFYDTIAIKERKNEKCRRNFMPKKYWKNLTEMQQHE